MNPGLEVRAFRSFADVEPYRPVLDAVNEASRQQCPFSTLAYLRTAYENDEFADQDDGREPLLLVAFEGGEPVGYLPLKRVRKHALGRAFTKLEFLLTHDTELPHLVASPEREPALRSAFLDHLFSREPRWSYLELKEQDESSGFEPLPPLALLDRYYVRRFDGSPVGVIPIEWKNVGEYFHSFNKKFRSNVGRQGRKLLALPEVQFVRASEPAAVRALFEVYLELETHSWKAQANGTIGRHPTRLRFFRQLLEMNSPLRIELDLLFVGGRPIGGFLNGFYLSRKYALEIAFDEAYRDFSPGLLMLLMGVKQAIDERREAYYLMQSYGYFKSRWGAQMIPTKSLQFFRLGQAPFYKAILGDLKRKLAVRGPEQEALTYNLARPNRLMKVAPQKSSISIEGLKAQTWDRDALASVMPFNVS